MIFNMVGKGGGSLLISDTQDTNGGTIRTITATKTVKLQTKTINPTTSIQTVNPDTGYDGFSQVTVNAGSGSINNQNKTVTPTINQQQIMADSGYTGLGTVTVNAMPTGTVTAPSSISGSSASVSTGTNTLTLSKTISVTPNVSTAGYISSGTAGNSSVSLTASVTTKGAATITPGTTNQTIASGTYLTGTQTIAGSSNLIASNIKKNVTIFGVTGSYEASGGSSTDFIVTLSYGEAENGIYGWVPNKTSSELYQAFLDNLNIITVIDKSSYGSQQVVALDAQYISDYGALSYFTAADLGSNTYRITQFSYVNDELEIIEDYTYIYPVFQSKTVSPTTSQQVIQPDSGYNGLEQVTINAMPTMTLPTSAASSATSGYTSKATISRSTSAQYINIPPGYNSTGAYYVISATPNGSATAPSSISGTSATVSTGTNTLTLTKTVSVTPTVSAGYVSSGTATNSSVSLTASVTTKAAATITPTTTNQTIASGTYLTGTQTIAGDADLVASNIVSGVQIFGVTGNVVLQNYYTGSSTPSSSLGSNGDIYLQS